MFVRKLPNGELILIAQTDHSRFVGQLAAHWGSSGFASPEPYDSVSRAATFHDFGWLRYETSPLIDAETGEPYEFRKTPFSQAQLDSYQWCIDWLGGIDRYSGVLVGMHRTGLWKGRYGKIAHPSGKYNPQGLRPEIQEFISRNEDWQQSEMANLDQDTLRVNYHLLQVWDLLGLYFCCQEPYDDYIEPVPTSYSASDKGSRLTMRPVDERQVAFEPYPFSVRPFKVQINCKRLPQTSFADLESFRRAYFQAEPDALRYELV
jgi:hypothetical protein